MFSRIAGFAAFLAVAAHEVGGQTSRPAQPIMVGAEDIRSACVFAQERKYSDANPRSPAGILGRFCRLEAPTTRQAASAWSQARVPTAIDVKTAAVREELSEEEPETPPVQSDTASSQWRLQEVVVSPGFATAFMPNQGVILVGAAQFAVGRAKEVVDIYVVQAFANRLCSGVIRSTVPWITGGYLSDSIRNFVPSTCRLLQSGKTGELMGARYGLPSWGIIQSALRRDLDVLPDTVMGRFRKYGAMSLVGPDTSLDLYRARQRLAATLAAARFSSSYLRAHDLPAAFRDAASDVAATLYVVCSNDAKKLALESDDCPHPWDAMPVVRNVLVASSLLGVLASQDLIDGDPAKRQAAQLRSLMALAVNTSAINAKEPGILRDAWENFAYGSRIENDGPGDLLFQVERVWPVVLHGFEALSALERNIRTQVAAAEGDRAKRLAAHVSALGDATSLFITALEPVVATEAEATDVLTLIQRVAAYPELRTAGRYTELLSDIMMLVSDVSGMTFGSVFQRVTFPAPAMRALQFAVDASGLQDADAFERVLMSHAAPVNGFLRKRTRLEGASRFYWSINMYVGAAYGREWAEDQSLPEQVGARYSGLALPFGAEFGFKSPVGPISGLLQVIDLGQVASWRSNQKGDTTITTTPPSLTFAGVFAPGINVVWNTPRYPFAIGVGYARAPQFRDIEPPGAEARKASVWRTVIFAAVDVPLIP